MMSTVSGTRVGRASTAGNKITVGKVLVYIVLVLWALISLFPVYWMLTFSLKNNAEIFGENVIGLPQNWVWGNYNRAMNTGHMEVYFLNSLIIAVLTILITLVAAAMATYAMTRLVWKGRETMNKFFMLGLTIPIHAAIVPLYVVLGKAHLLFIVADTPARSGKRCQRLFACAEDLRVAEIGDRRRQIVQTRIRHCLLQLLCDLLDRRDERQEVLVARGLGVLGQELMALDLPDDGQALDPPGRARAELFAFIHKNHLGQV